MSARVLSFNAVSQDETIQTLEILLRQALRGEIVGLLYAYETASEHHPLIGSAGRYRRDPFLAIGVTSFMLREFHAVADAYAHY